MPSLRSRIALALLRNRHYLRFQLSKPVYDDSTSIEEIRREVEQSSRYFKPPRGVEFIPANVPTVNAEWVRPVQPETEGAILYFHGGGYVMGNIVAHRPHVAKFALGSGAPALSLGYRLAPEHPFPAAVEDGLAAYRWLLDQMPATRIVLAGDSAGGGLCLASLLAIRDTGLPLPAGAAAMSPWTDLTLSGESQCTKRDICLSPPGSPELFRKLYAGGQDLKNPWISPLFGDLTGLPPLMLFAGEEEIMRDDTARFAQKAVAAGVNATLHVEPGMVHCYPALAPLLPEAEKAMNEICAFIRSRIAAGNAGG